MIGARLESAHHIGPGLAHRLRAMEDQILVHFRHHTLLAIRYPRGDVARARVRE